MEDGKGACHAASIRGPVEVPHGEVLSCRWRGASRLELSSSLVLLLVSLKKSRCSIGMKWMPSLPKEEEEGKDMTKEMGGSTNKADNAETV